MTKKWNRKKLEEALANEGTTYRNGPAGRILFKKNELTAMVAICKLAQRQTEDELRTESTKHENGRGFSQAHAKIGTELAKELTGGQMDGVFRCLPRGGVKFSKWPDSGKDRWWNKRVLCVELAKRYMDQIVEIANEHARKLAEAAGNSQG